jgi:hypothetical protein
VYGNSFWVDPAARLSVVALTNTAVAGTTGDFPDSIIRNDACNGHRVHFVLFPQDGPDDGFLNKRSLRRGDHNEPSNRRAGVSA